MYWLFGKYKTLVTKNRNLTQMSLIFQVSNNIENHYMLENFHKLLFVFWQHNRNLSKMTSYLLSMKVDNIETQWWWIMSSVYICLIFLTCQIIFFHKRDKNLGCLWMKSLHTPHTRWKTEQIVELMAKSELCINSRPQPSQCMRENP